MASAKSNKFKSINKYYNIVTGCWGNRIPGNMVPLLRNGETIYPWR
jgi:hypothetical protein